MTEIFLKACNLILQFEGGYVNDPRDPGGETNFGISKRAYPNEDIKNMTRTRAQEIYWRDYWLATGCDKLAPPLALLVFDGAVNCGPRTAVKLLQEVVKTNADGIIGPLTLTAIDEWYPPGLLRGYTQRREQYYRSLSNFSIYGKGWLNRLSFCLIEALDWLEASEAGGEIEETITTAPQNNSQDNLNEELTSRIKELGYSEDLAPKLAAFSIRFVDGLLKTLRILFKLFRAQG